MNQQPETVEQREERVITINLEKIAETYRSSDKLGRVKLDDTVSSMLEMLTPGKYDTYWGLYLSLTERCEC